MSVENGLFRLKPKSGFLTPSKKFYTCFFTHRIAHPTTKYTPTRPHTHTRYHTEVSYKALTLAWPSLLWLLAASQRGAFLAPLASNVYHTTAAARGIDAILQTTATPVVAWRLSAECSSTNVALAAFCYKPKATNSMGRGFVEREHALLAQNAQSTELPTDFRPPYSSTPSHQPPLGRRAQKLTNRLD